MLISQAAKRATGVVSVSGAICDGLGLILKQCAQPRKLRELFGFITPRHGDFIIAIPLDKLAVPPVELQKHPYYLVNSLFTITADNADEEGVLKELAKREAKKFTTDLKEAKGHRFEKPYFYPRKTREYLMVPLWIPRE